jgi:hypothetical protein
MELASCCEGHSRTEGQLRMARLAKRTGWLTASARMASRTEGSKSDTSDDSDFADRSSWREGASLRAVIFFYLHVRVNARLFASRAAVPKKSRPATRSFNAKRSNPFDPCHPKYPGEPSVLDACPMYAVKPARSRCHSQSAQLSHSYPVTVD